MGVDGGQHLVGLHQVTGAGGQMDRPCQRGHQVMLHLHGLHGHQDFPGLDFIPVGDRDSHHRAGHWRTHLRIGGALLPLDGCQHPLQPRLAGQDVNPAGPAGVAEEELGGTSGQWITPRRFHRPRDDGRQPVEPAGHADPLPLPAGQVAPTLELSEEDNISSTAGMVSIVGSPNVAYVGSKFASRGMTKHVAVQYGPDNIRVNSVHPGYIKTPMMAAASGADGGGIVPSIPLRRMAEP